MRDMRNVINILNKSDGTNSFGEPIGNWEIIFSDVFASKEPLLGKEYFSAEAVQSKVEVKFRTYYFDGVKNEMRIECDGEIYEILSAINVKSMNRELLMYCKLVK